MRNRFDDLDPEEREMVARAGLDKLHCPPFDRMLAAQSGVLEEGEAAPLRRHLESCRYCQALAADFLQGESAAPSTQNLDHVRARLNKGIAGIAKPAPWWRQWQVFAAIAGAAACLAIAVNVNQQSPEVKKSTGTGAPSVEAPKPRFRLPLSAPPVKLSVGSAIVWRGESATNEETYLKDLGAALAPYRAGQYAEAASQLAAVTKKYPQSAEAAFYLGVSLLHQNQPQPARAALEKAEALRPQALRDEVQWFLGVAWERTGNPGQAAAQLKPLCATPGPYHDAACSALPHLR
ncbi:MAG: tetratricopeptide repeat protein [Acidobacteria bacterium]|nr:tetratricopeptide repeat protein [Acidobacteriota bacterium]